MGGIRIERLDPGELKRRGIGSWPIWEEEASRFDWSYDQTEECLILEGHVVVETDQGNVEFGEGDFVTFPKGLSCVWDIKRDVRKHYRFV